MEKQLKPGRFLKKRIVDEYEKKFQDSSSFFVTEYSGLTVKDVDGLRKKLRPFSAKYLIVKNTLCRLALKNIKKDSLAEMIGESCALSYGAGDAIMISKVLVDFEKQNSNFKLRGGYVDGDTVTPANIKELASLPSRDILMAKLLYCINSPISGFVTACSGIIKKMVYALNEIAKNKEAK